MARHTLTIASGNYTSTAYLGEIRVAPGDYSLVGVKAALAGNVGDATLAVYVAGAGKTSLTNAEKALGEVYFNDAVVAAADPTPDLNVVGDPIDFTVAADESIYVVVSPDGSDTAVSGTVRLETR